MKIVFQDLENCSTYDIVFMGSGSGSKFEFTTKDFYVIKGKVVGKRLEATASTKADEAATGHLSALARKCEEAAPRK